MTNATYFIISLIWAMYGLALGFAAGTIYRLLGNMTRR